jgi:hypothetical protein
MSEAKAILNNWETTLMEMNKPLSELMGWGLTRPRTIADGAPICSFRFKKGGATYVPIPQPLLTPLETKAKSVEMQTT